MTARKRNTRFLLLTNPTTGIQVIEDKSDLRGSPILLNPDKEYIRGFQQIRMNSKYVAVVAALAVMLVAATAFATTDSAFAKKKSNENNAANSQAIDCGNGELPLNVGCQATSSINQGKENVASQASEQIFGEEE